MDPFGLSDSLAGAGRQPCACPNCGGTIRVAGDACVHCLLHTALDGEEGDGTAALDAALTEIDMRDTNWRLGNYEILEEIGRGGMGVIYRARQRHSGRIVALKRVLGYHGDSLDTLERFRREAQAAASLDHPNILPIYEVGESDGLPFFTMKFATGGSLQNGAAALSSDPSNCVRLLMKVARAVAHAHEQGILHRDLKPGNILLDSRCEPMVSDFGLAKWIDATTSLTRSLTIFGTPGFIAPEQAHGSSEVRSPAADIYSLGAILFDLLTGRPPFLGEHALAVVRQAAENEAPKLRSIVKSLDRDLETICARCLERDPAARYPSAAAVADDLERWLQRRPIIARPVSAPVRGWRWARRNPVLASAICACLVLGGIGITRQIRSQNLQSALNRQALAQHSIAVLPFLDCNSGMPDRAAAAFAATVLQKDMSAYGPARVDALAQPIPRWTGAGTQEEVQEAAKQTGHRSVLAGTVRRTPAGTRYSIHLLRPGEHQLLGSWTLEVDENTSFEAQFTAKGIGSAAYRMLEQRLANQSPIIDPAMENDRARPYMITGRDLLARRNLPDMERAIACFEGAVREEPRSLSARSFLAMAYTGRHFLSADPTMAARALATAREALEIAPENPAGHRAYAFVCMSNGRYAEAEEHSLRAIEAGDQSERAFGHIAFTWRMRGRPDLAIRWYQKAKMSQRQPADYDALLGDCYLDLGLDKMAQHQFESAAAYQPDHPEGWIGLCHLKLLAGDLQGARAIYQAQLPDYPASQSAAEMAALVEFFGRNYPEAERRYTELAEKNPGGGGANGFQGAVDFTSALALIKMQRGEIEHAHQLLEARISAESQHLAEVPDDSESLYRLAASEALLGRDADAARHLAAAFAAGWLDFRSPSIDPRFDEIAKKPEFQEILTQMALRMTALRSDMPDLSPQDTSATADLQAGK